MDNIQFWVYLAFGAIYLITRMMKKKKGENQPEGSADQSTERSYKKPVSFEDLLKEFTQVEDVEPQEDEYADQQRRIEEARAEEESLQKQKEEEEIDSINQDHTHRRFADDESREIYEKSIVQAEGADLSFERDEHFKTKLNRQEEVEEGSTIGSEILASLQDADQAKKAVILSEILNRKY
ncbi:MAG: hypothetical protein JXR03_13380 [Cyclobacteriaceae bacterium]